MNRDGKKTSRRAILHRGGAAIAGWTILHNLAPAARADEPQPRKKITVGIVADVHQDIIHDGWARMRAFIDDMKKRKVDGLIQLGDFALPLKRNQPFLDVWNQYEGPKHHALGNHDMDLGFTKAQTMKWWNMPARHYSFEIGGWHFVVLDGNDKNPGKWSGYVRYVAEDQRRWLAEDLAATDAPTMILSHQTIESDRGVANSGEVRAVIEEANRAAGRKKVYACLCGHHHTDGLTEINGIRYIHINSMSYKWVGAKNKQNRFADHIERAFPLVSSTAPYRDPLYTTLTLDPVANTMQIEGRKTEFIPPTPTELKMERAGQMLPIITQRELKLS